MGPCLEIQVQSGELFWVKTKKMFEPFPFHLDIMKRKRFVLAI